MSMNDMTEAEVRLQDDKMRAEIAKLVAETAKINTENRWYLLIVGAAFFAGAAAFTKLFL
ncbi:hypothetical protein [uncultured Ruegeria sp.]|uniref:hypothetical protein n=1 Tax=uncultured Ruegeria sp. TaxID=259304 RepID=UPI00262F849E|nr:hypothetical protein [uncultured Ruegeria sp.]